MRKKLKIFVIAMLLLLCTVQLYKGLKSSASIFAKTEASRMLSQAVNESAASVLEPETNSYSDFCKVVRDSEGNVLSVELNSTGLNSVRTQIILNLLNSLTEISEKEFSVPLGTAMNSTLFSGLGPGIKIRMIPLGTVTGEIKSVFVSQGINQTLHKIDLELRLCVKVAAPFESASLDLNYSICIAETLIVGKVPQFYAERTQP